MDQHYFVIKKLHLNNKSNSFFPKNILHFIESWIANIDVLDEISVKYELKDKPQSKLFNVEYSGEVKYLPQFGKYNQNRLIISCLNINFLRNKFESFTEKTKGNVNILIISESKIDEIFPGS